MSKVPKEIEPLKDNVCVVNIGYTNMVLQHEDAMQLLDALKKAEAIENPYTEEQQLIKPIVMDVSVKYISHEHYIQAKTRYLLGIE